MTERKPDTAREWVDPDEAPEWTDEMFDMAEYSVGGKVIRPATGVLTKDGMRPIAERRQEVTLRLPPNVIEHFKASGEGWQARMGEALERHVGGERSSRVAEAAAPYKAARGAARPKRKK